LILVPNIYFNAFTIDGNSARYLLSSLVQSLAAIIAIVVTLTLVAVQLTASAYSPRVIDIFKKDWVMWLLLVWYGLSIFFGLFVLEMIGGKYQSLGHWGVSLESCVFLAYLMGVAAFAGLFLHLINVFNLLNPTNIAMELLKDLIKDKNKTTDRILKSVESARDQKLDPKQHPEDDPLQPIVAIIRGSLAKYDFEMTRAGLNAIVVGMLEIIRPFSIDTGLKEDLISGKSSKKLKSAFKNNRHLLPESLIVNKGTKLAIHKVSVNWWITGNVSGKEKIYVVKEENGKLNVYGCPIEETELSRYFCIHLKQVGKLTIEKENEISTFDVVNSLKKVGMSTAEKKLENATPQIILSLEWVGKISAESGLRDVTGAVVGAIRNVGETAAESGLMNATSQAVTAIKTVGKIAIGQKWEDVIKYAVQSLIWVGIAPTHLFSWDNVPGGDSDGLIRFLKDELGIGWVESVESDGDKTIRICGDGKSAEMTIDDAEKKVTLKISGGKTYDLTVKRENGTLNIHAATSNWNAAKSLAELTILSEETVTKEIQECEKLMGFQDLLKRDIFDKFMNLYEHELEKLRAEQSG
jgi:stage V sporulation protein SpoVS